MPKFHIEVSAQQVLLGKWRLAVEAEDEDTAQEDAVVYISNLIEAGEAELSTEGPLFKIESFDTTEKPSNITVLESDVTPEPEPVSQVLTKISGLKTEK